MSEHGRAGSDIDHRRAALIEQVREYNRGARHEFLIQFDEHALALYLEHLRATAGPRDRHAVWSRPGDTPAVIVHVPDD